MKKHQSRLRVVALVVELSALAAVAFSVPMRQPATVTGTAIYRERIALPPNAVFEATLEDVSRSDAPAEELGRARLEKPGQPPFRFSIPFDRSRIKADGIYSVRARILIEGKSMFATTQSYPVLTRGKGNMVTMILQRATAALEGMFLYMADAATFTDCQTGQRWPVAMEREYKTLESAYLKARKRPGEELKVNVQGRVEMRPKADAGGQVLTVVVERYLGIWPGEICDTPAPAPPLQETSWKLTRLLGKPVILADGQREPNLTFRTEQNRLTGSTGCNNLVGSYRFKGNDMTLSGIAVTRMACLQGMEVETEFFTALGKVQKYRILGQHLELYDANNNMLARFAARTEK
jgi:uncharacterized lipoprotein YbaY/heat shock protein HslJ